MGAELHADASQGCIVDKGRAESSPYCADPIGGKSRRVVWSFGSAKSNQPSTRQSDYIDERLANMTRSGASPPEIGMT